MNIENKIKDSSDDSEDIVHSQESDIKEYSIADTTDSNSEKKIKGFSSRLSLLKRILLIIGLVIILLIAVAGISFLIFCNMGKESLHNVNNTAIDKSTIEEAKNVYYNGKEYTYKDDLINILVIGTDLHLTVQQRKELKDSNAGGMADLLFLVTIDPTEDKVDVIAINRYSVTKIEEYYEDFEGNAFSFSVEDQICRQYSYGKGLEDSCERQAKAVSSMLNNIPINGYVSLSIDAIKPLNDVVGGIELEVLENVLADVSYGAVSRLHNATGKTITLTDDEAYAYVRWRITDQPGGSDLRLLRQRQYVKALLSKMISLTKNDITFPLKVKDSLSDYLVTDIDLTEMVYMGMTVLNSHIDWDNVGSIPGESYIMDSYYDENEGVTVYHEGFKVNREELQAMIIERFYKAKE